jgi:hypothetical protein
MPDNSVRQEDVSWRVARSCNGGHCVRVGVTDAGVILIADSKDPEGPILSYNRAEFAAFADGIRRGDFDDFL